MRFTVIAAQALALGLAAAAPVVDKRGNCDKSTTTSSSKAATSSSSSAAVKVATTNVVAAAVVTAVSSSSSSAAALAAVSSSSSSSLAAAASTVAASTVGSSASSSAAAASVAASTSTISSTAAAVVAASTTSSSSASVVTPTIVPSVGSYTYQLCAAEPEVNGVSTRLLTGQQEQGQSAMTVESCASWCSGYTYFGLEYGSECYCGNTITTGTTLDTTNGCSMVCDGNTGEYCGGSWRMQLYALGSAGSVTLPSTYSASAATATATGTGSGSGTATTTTAVSVASATGASSLIGWESVGCVIEPFDNGGSGRGLTGQSTSGSAMSLEACATFCTGWDYFGVEYADECYCGDALAANTAWDLLSCADPCAGNSAEICGGGGHFNLYQLSNMTLVTLPTYGVATTTASTATSTASVVAAVSSVVSNVVAAASVSTTAISISSVSSTNVAAVASVASTAAAVVASVSAVVSAVVAPVTTTKVSVASTMSTVVSVASATASTCAPPTSTAVSSLSSTFLNTKYTFSHYFSGSGCSLNSANPGNISPSLLPPITLAISGSNALGTAASSCVAKAGILSLVYKSFDLHYRTDTCAWECVMYPGTNTAPSYFNVQNSVISQTHGYSC